jgi:hypothetical protein
MIECRPSDFVSAIRFRGFLIGDEKNGDFIVAPFLFDGIDSIAPFLSDGIDSIFELLNLDTEEGGFESNDSLGINSDGGTEKR